MSYRHNFQVSICVILVETVQIAGLNILYAVLKKISPLHCYQTEPCKVLIDIVIIIWKRYILKENTFFNLSLDFLM